MNYEQKHPILQKLEEYFKNTPKEQIDKDWSNILKDTDSEAYYEKKYKEALSRATFYNNELLTDNQRKMLLDIFPELKNEDEITRKSLIRFLKSPFVHENITDEKVTPWIAWLEKQGKKLDADKVVGWLVANICDYEYYVKLFKKDFGI